jgi:chemotaxis protein MotA
MRLGTIIGYFLGISIIVVSIMGQGGVDRLKAFFEPFALLIVLGCTVGALLINYTFKELWSGIKGLKYTFMAKPPDPEKYVQLLVAMAIKARREGFLSLRDEAAREKMPILSLGIGLIADGTDPEITREILETSAVSEAGQFGLIEMLWRDVGVYGPMFGMICTLIGLVVMLGNLTDPASIGPAMALALIGTFYGIVLAGIVCLPIAGKIRNYNERLGLLRVLIVEGLLSIQAGDNSQIVEEKLKARLVRR